MSLNGDDREQESEKFFEEVANTEGTREIEDDGDGLPRASRSEAEEASPNVSDLKSTLITLFPKISLAVLNRVAKAAMVGRIAPDIFLDIQYLTVTDIVEMWDDKRDGELDVQEIINLVYFAFSIGLDGKGRMDAIQVHSNSTDTSRSDLSALGSTIGA